MTDRYIEGGSPWHGRSLAAPALPGGNEAQKQRLVEFLEFVGRDLPARWLQSDEDVNRTQYQLGKLGLTERTSSGLVLTQSGFDWLNSQDDSELFHTLHDHIAFFGEILRHLQDHPSTAGQLLSLASDEFHLPWRSLDQVRRRLAWLRVLDLIEEGGERDWHVTTLGREALTMVELVDSEVLTRTLTSAGAAELPSAPPLVAGALSTTSSASRNTSVGYLPRDPVKALRLLVRLVITPLDRKALETGLASQLELATSSASSFIQTARLLGLHHYVGKDLIEATPLGYEWRDSGSAINLVRLMHARFYPFGEVLRTLSEGAMSAGAVHRKMFPTESNRPAQDRTTMVLRRMSEAGAVSQIGPFRYVLTDVGRALAQELPLDDVGADEVSVQAQATTARPANNADLARSLMAAAVDVAHPDRFEKMVALAFTALGVEARHLGGPGATDVLIDIETNLTRLGRVIVDAKTAASGSLREDSVVFETLKEHAVLHEASHIAVIAPGYQTAGRLPTRATSSGITLITAQGLSHMLEEHDQHPFEPEDVWQFLTGDAGYDLEDKRETQRSRLRSVDLVLRELETERAQMNAQPIFARDIYRSLRRQTAITQEEVEDVLRFLGQPWVGVVSGDAKSGFTLPATRDTASRRLMSLANAVQGHIQGT